MELDPDHEFYYVLDRKTDIAPLWENNAWAPKLSDRAFGFDSEYQQRYGFPIPLAGNIFPQSGRVEPPRLPHPCKYLGVGTRIHQGSDDASVLLGKGGSGTGAAEQARQESSSVEYGGGGGSGAGAAEQARQESSGSIHYSNGLVPSRAALRALLLLPEEEGSSYSSWVPAFNSSRGCARLGRQHCIGDEDPAEEHSFEEEQDYIDWGWRDQFNACRILAREFALHLTLETAPGGALFLHHLLNRHHVGAGNRMREEDPNIKFPAGVTPEDTFFRLAYELIRFVPDERLLSFRVPFSGEVYGHIRSGYHYLLGSLCGWDYAVAK